MLKTITCAILVALLGTAVVQAQTNINLGGITVDQEAAVEVVSDSLSVDQDTGVAVFVGNVVVVQGDLRLSAAQVEVIYGQENTQIEKLVASGGVTFVTATEAAESQDAVYSLPDGILVMTGDVLLTQGSSAISAEKMRVNTDDGTAVMEGRVRTILQQGKNDG